MPVAIAANAAFGRLPRQAPYLTPMDEHSPPVDGRGTYGRAVLRVQRYVEQLFFRQGNQVVN